MASKRKSDNEGDDRNLEIPVQQSKRRHGDSGQMAIRAIGNLRVALRISDIASSIENLLRRMLGEELDRQLVSSPTVNQIGRSGAKTSQLRFTDKVASTIFTKSKVKSEKDKLLQIELVDARSQSIIKEGPLSSIKIKIYVLNGEFGSKGREDWTADHFDANILRQREGREPLLKGETLIRLQNGVGTITNLELTDNSRCTRSGKFRLGAKVAESCSNEENIREGISEAFKVKDCRGEEYKKHDRPSLNDNIWRLNKIAKNGKIHKRLSSDGIKTVKDLLRLYVTNPSSLQEMKKYANIPEKKWEAIIKHANACDIDKYDDYKIYIYPTDQQPQQMRLLFNPIYMLVGVAFNGQNYLRPVTLTAAEDKDTVERVKQHAYKNLKDLISIDEATTISLLTQLAASPHQSLQQINFTSGFPTAHQVHDPMPQSSYAGGDQFSSHLTCTDGWTLAGSQLPVAPPDYSSTTYLPHSIALVQYGPEHSIPSFIPNSAIDISRRGTRKSMWYKILAAFKCLI